MTPWLLPENRAALEWLKKHEEHGIVTLYLNSYRSVAEQLIGYVREELAV